MNYCESDISYQQSMLHALEMLSCFEYQFSAKTTKMAIFNKTVRKSWDVDMFFLIS